MSAGMRAALFFTAGLLVLACAYLGYRTHILLQAVASLQSRTIPHDIKQVMARKLYYADKTWYAGQARDWQAAGWYAWQVWRMGNSIAEAGIENANGPLAKLEQSMFLPTIDPLIEAMRNDDVAAFEARYRDMVAACNACHAAPMCASAYLAKVSAVGTRPSRPVRSTGDHRCDGAICPVLRAENIERLMNRCP